MARARSAMRGFTLTEMMVTVVVLAVILAVAVPSFRQLMASQRIKTASFDLFSAMNLARSEAIKNNAAVALRAGAATDGGWSTGWRVVDGAGTVLRSWGAIASLTVTNTAPGAATVLTFGNDGRLLPNALQKLQIDPVTATTGVSARCVQMALNGRPTTQTGACP